MTPFNDQVCAHSWVYAADKQTCAKCLSQRYYPLCMKCKRPVHPHSKHVSAGKYRQWHPHCAPAEYQISEVE